MALGLIDYNKEALRFSSFNRTNFMRPGDLHYDFIKEIYRHESITFHAHEMYNKLPYTSKIDRIIYVMIRLGVNPNDIKCQFSGTAVKDKKIINKHVRHSIEKNMKLYDVKTIFHKK